MRTREVTSIRRLAWECARLSSRQTGHAGEGNKKKGAHRARGESCSGAVCGRAGDGSAPSSARGDGDVIADGDAGAAARAVDAPDPKAKEEEAAAAAEVAAAVTRR